MLFSALVVMAVRILGGAALPARGCPGDWWWGLIRGWLAPAVDAPVSTLITSPVTGEGVELSIDRMVELARGRPGQE